MTPLVAVVVRADADVGVLKAAAEALTGADSCDSVGPAQPCGHAGAGRGKLWALFKELKVGWNFLAAHRIL